MRVTTIARKLLGVTQLVVETIRFEEGGAVVVARPRWRRPRCGVCRRKAAGYDRLRVRRWRSLPIGRLRVSIEYAPLRVRCSQCGVRVEAVPWADHGSRFTAEFEEMAAYLAQATDRTTVTQQLGTSWRAVGGIIDRVVARRLEASRLDGVKRIGVDEFSYRKRHRYVTVVVDHDRQRVIWAGEGRGAATLKAFFDELGPARLARLETATIDMAAGYIKAFEEHAPHVGVVFDRFHVQRLASDALDEVRRELWRRQRETPEGDAIKGSRYALLKNPWNLSRTERQKLSTIQATNRPLYRAYLLKESLARALDYRQPARATAALDDWLTWARRSKLAPFVRAARTISGYKHRILGYIKERLTNGIVEGINNRLRAIARRAFGFHSPQPLLAMLFLCCGGISLHPPLPGTARAPT